MRFPDREETPGRFPPNLSLSLSLCLSLLLTACLEDTPPVRDTTIHLSVVHEGTFSIHLRVSVADSSDIWTFELTRDDSVVNTTTTQHSQLTISDGGLNPGQTYRYRAHRLIDGEITASSAEVSAATLDTTSHNFYWTIDTLGEYGSYLNDVAIIDENNIWVVGALVIDDSTAVYQGQINYNAAFWDGIKWNYVLIGPPGNILYSIFTFDIQDIWVSNYCSPYHWDGLEWTYYRFSSGGVGVDACAGNAIWGSSPEDIWFVGANGSIVHYGGSGFERMESGMELNLLDVWGTNGDNIWSCGQSSDMNYSMLLHRSEGNWETIVETYFLETLRRPPVDTIYADISSVWDCGTDSLWLTGSWGVFKMSKLERKFRWVYHRRWDAPRPYESGYPHRIRGNADNDVFVVGQIGTLLHYNGHTWNLYREFFQPFLSLNAVDVRENVVVAIGHTPENKAIIIRGSR